MQPLAGAAAALVVVLLCAGPAASTSLGEAMARAWLREHAAPQSDELAELRSQNPEAYAIVKALLTKRALGLLNPKHPSASFATPSEPAEREDVAASGPEVFHNLAAEGTHHLAAAAHGDWLNWKPQDSAVNDEEMVKSVLGAVAELKGANPQNSLLGRSQAPSPDSDDQSGEPSLEWKNPSDGAGSTREAPAVAKPIVSQAQENSYLKRVSFDSEAPVAPQQATVQENPYLQSFKLDAKTSVVAPQLAGQENAYLKGIDVGASLSEAPRPKKEVQPDSSNYLASFSWDDESKPQVKHAALRAARTKPAFIKPQPIISEGSSPMQPPSKPAHTNALLSWLGGGAEHASVAKAPKPTAAPQPENLYMADLQ